MRRLIGPSILVFKLDPGPAYRPNLNIQLRAMKALLFLALSLAVAAQDSGRCPANSPLRDLALTPSWNGWGNGTSNSRYQGSSAQLDATQAARLKLKWAFGFPGAKSVYGQPTVAGGRVFVGVDTGDVYSIDAATGCSYWSYKAAGPVRTVIVSVPERAGPDRAAMVRSCISATKRALLMR